MKIAIISHLKHPIAEPFHGGLEMHTHALTKQLQGRGHEVTLFALAGSDPAFNVQTPVFSPPARDRQVDPTEGEPDCPPAPVNKRYAYLDIMRRITKGGFDIVHNNSLHFIPLTRAHTLPCPMVTTLHTPPFPSLQDGALQAKHYSGNHFVSVSKSLARDWSRYINRSEVIYNGIDAQAWNFSGSPAPRTAIWVGRFCPEKGPEYAIEAARRAGYRLKLAGSVYDQGYYNLKIAPRLGPDVEVVGHLDHGGLCKLMGEAEVGLFTSIWDEPFGLVIAELLACGTPIVAFDSGATREVIDENCGVIVPKRDVVAMATAIPQAASLPRTACRARVTEHFPVQHMVTGYEKCYHQLLMTHCPGQPALPVTHAV